jgi:riboflavin kinase / FMN adenylyltransferase
MPSEPDIRVHPPGKLRSGTVEDRPLHMAIGMFDGVHRGHQAVIRQAVDAARGTAGDCSGVLTFDPHPSRVLHAAQATALLMPLDTRVEHMLDLGVDHVFVKTFTREYARLSAEAFVPMLCESFPALRSLHVGANFRFGAGRAGDVDVLHASAARLGIEARVLQPEHAGGLPVSSSRIRELVSAGRMSEANTLLGRPYTVSGRIVPGRQVGRQWGFPTLNLPWNPEAAPQFGVYRVLLHAGSSAPAPGLANYGLRPTVGAGPPPLLEVHLLDPAELPPPGAFVHVSLLDFIRPEQAFPSVDALRERIREDVAIARAAWAAAPAQQSAEKICGPGS